MRYQGKLIEWHDDKGYGFIQPVGQHATEQKIFLHIRSFARRGPRPLPGAWLEYEVIQDGKGRLNAQRVRYVRPQHSVSTPAATPAANATLKKSAFNRPVHQHWRGGLITLYSAFIIALQWTQQLPHWFMILPLLLSGLAYWLYAVDKKAAQQGSQRIAEKNLHLLALLGGWPGALLAQQTLRHKSAKVKFLQLFWATVILNWVLLFMVSMPMVRQLLQ